MAAAADSEALAYFVRRDVLGEPAGPVETLWELPEARLLLERQRADGSWKYAGKPEDRPGETAYQLLVIACTRWDIRLRTATFKRGERNAPLGRPGGAQGVCAVVRTAAAGPWRGAVRSILGGRQLVLGLN
jgi:hypothetical protein